MALPERCRSWKSLRCLSLALGFGLGGAELMTSSPLQFTEEKLGQAEKTELDAHFENLLARADCTKNWTEKILRQTEVLLQPNPSKLLVPFSSGLVMPPGSSRVALSLGGWRKFVFAGPALPC